MSRFADYTASGSVRYVLLTGGFDEIASNPVLWAVETACIPVDAVSLPEKYRDNLYDCAGRAARIRQHAAETATGPQE